MALTRPITVGRDTQGCMYSVDDATTQLLYVDNEYHAVVDLSEGSCLSGATFLASSTGAITDTADNGGVLRCTDVGHGLTTGQYVTLVGMVDTAHNGATRVTRIDADTFDADDVVYNSINDTGQWKRGTSLTVNNGFDNDVAIDFSASFTSSVNQKAWKFGMFINAVLQEEYLAQRNLFTAGGYGYSGSGGLGSLVSGDVIWWGVMNLTDDTNMIFRHCSVRFK